MQPRIDLELYLKQLFVEKKLTLATAESCTGGLLGGRITDVPGSSEYFIGGVVSYAYEAKEILLGVNNATLVRFGAVSSETVIEMAHGMRKRLATDVAISISGIAGPGGATPDKPVGLIWLGLSDIKEDRSVRLLTGRTDRDENRLLAVEKALEMLIEWAETQPAPAKL